MYTVSNHFTVKKGFASRMATAFTSQEELTTFEGFQKVEVMLNSTPEEHDELYVQMYWDTLEHFEAWKASDHFKKSHDRERAANPNSPILSNRVIIAEIVSTLTV